MINTILFRLGLRTPEQIEQDKLMFEAECYAKLISTSFRRQAKDWNISTGQALKPIKWHKIYAMPDRFYFIACFEGCRLKKVVINKFPKNAPSSFMENFFKDETMLELGYDLFHKFRVIRDSLDHQILILTMERENTPIRDRV